MTKILQLHNGIRVAYTYDDHVRSVHWGVFVKAGSLDEDETNNGISHMIEHMCFKGTSRRTAADIAAEMDAIGAELNAFTSKERTAYYVHCLDENLEQCLDVLSDILLHHTFDKQELEREKQVVLEEIDMTEDTPDDVVHDVAAISFWGEDAAVSRPILGSKENVLSFSSEDLFAYERRFYVRENVIVSVVGHVSEEDVIRLGDAYFDFPSGEAKQPMPVFLRQTKQIAKEKDVEQCNVVLSFDGYCDIDKDSAALSVFDFVLGGGMSSILFQRVREQLGLAYSVFSYSNKYESCGSFNIYLGTNPAKLDKALSTVADIVREIRQNGIGEEQLANSKRCSRSRYVLGLESNATRMRAQARWLLNTNEAFDENERIKAMNAVTMEDVRRIIDHVFAAPPSIAVVAKRTDKDYTEYFNG